MALDKQKILNELGSVVNQLQSADCGCMGKLFSNSSDPKPPCCGCGYGCQHMRSCCDCRNNSACGHPIYNSPCAGEPCTGVRNCMGYCNPPKLYADTYNYLNHNLMQPAMREVYNDLTSITPGNTIMNNPMGAQMGLSAASPNQGNMPSNSMPGGMPDQNTMLPGMGHPPVHHTHFTNAVMNPNLPPMNQLNQQQGMGQMGHDMAHMDPGMGQGMGQPGKEIAPGHMGNEMAHEMGHMGGPDMGQPVQGMGHVRGPGMSEPVQEMGYMAQSMGQPRQGMSGHMGPDMGYMRQGMGNMRQGMAHSGGMLAGMGPQIVNMMAKTTNNNMHNRGRPPPNGTGDMPPNDMGQMPPNMQGDVIQGHYHSGHMPHNAGYMEMTQGDPRMQADQPKSQPNAFPVPPTNAQANAMPGNMNTINLSTHQMGNMNANPNPYGQHSAGMAKFNQMFPGVMKGDLDFNPMAIAIQMNPANQQKSAMDAMQKMMMNNANAAGMSRIMDTTGKASTVMQPVVNATNAAAACLTPPPNRQLSNQAPGQQNIPQQIPGNTSMQNNQMPQQAYATLTEAPPVDQQQIPLQQIATQEQQRWQQQQPPSDQGQRKEATPLGALPTLYEGAGDPNARQQPPIPDRMYKEPILPADTSRNLLHSHHFKPQRFFEFNTLGQPIDPIAIRHPTEHHNLPQTLSPQQPPMRYNNVKSTVSKTALTGNRPVGKTPSRSQLQQVYNQYKGSQSYTQQNIRPSARNGSFSEGHLNIPQGNMPHHTSLENIERHGGDTAANNQMRQMEQVGDPMGKKPDEFAMVVPTRNARLRNGLQDQVYTAYPTSAKWSFHGSTPAPFSTGYRIKNK